MFDLVFVMGIIAFAGWTSITMSIQQFRKVRYHYHMKNLEMILHISLLILSPFVFIGLIFFGFFLIYLFGVLTTGQL
jgi:hypothetical protein